MSSLLVALAGFHIFPGDAISIQASVSVPDQSGQKMRVEKFSNIGESGDFISALTNNNNFKNNNPTSRSWTSKMGYTNSDPQEEFFGRRMTGAFCPTISGVYKMVLTDVDDYLELWIARENPNNRNLEWTGGVIKETLNSDFNSRKPVRADYAMEAYKVYPFIHLFVEKQVGDQVIFHWRKPGDSADSEIPADAFCTGWSNFHGGALRVFFPFFLLPNVQVTFTIEIVPNPSCPRLANTQIASAIQVLDYQGPALYSTGGTIQSSSSGSYPATFHGQSACKLGVVFSVNDTSAASSEVVGRFTPTQYIPAFSSLVVTLAGSNVFPAGASSDRARIRVSTAHTGNNNIRVEKFVLANDASPFRVKMVENTNFKENNPHLTTFASEITHLQTNPGEDHFGLRWTGAFCPPEDGLYDFVLPGVDDYFELHIGNHISNSFTQIMTQAHPMAVQPFTSQFYMQAGKMYPFIAIFVEASGEDFLTLKWRLPSSGPQSPAVAIPPSAFCTGWSFFNNSVLTMYSPFAMVPGVEVTFTIRSLSNPLCPRPNATVSSAILFPQSIPLMNLNSVGSSIQSSSSGSYPDRTVPSSSLAITMAKIGGSKVLNMSFTSPVRLVPPFAVTVTLSGQSFSFSGPSVVFFSPAGSAATAALSQSPLVLTVQVQSFGGAEYVPEHTPVIFALGNVTYSVPGDKVSGIPSSILGGDRRCLSTSSSGVLAAIPRSQWAFMCGTASNGWSCDL